MLRQIIMASVIICTGWLGFLKAKPNELPPQVTTPIITEITSSQDESTPTSPQTVRNWIVSSKENLALIFQKLDFAQSYVAELLNTTHGDCLSTLQPEQKLSFQLDSEERLTELIYWQTPQQGVRYYESGNGFESALVHKDVEKITRYASVEITNSLFADGQKNGLNDKLILSLAEVFGWDIDFALDLRAGDTFKILFDELFVEGESIGYGDILFAEFTNQGKRFQAIRYTNPAGEANYYTPDGYSLRKAFIRTPVKFTRISSKFDLNRHHPVLHTIRAHKGVDYAAPRGTPVKATGDGRIIFAAKKGGYGNVIEIQHGKQYSTLYAHLDQFAPKVREGALIKQGQTIGYVGSTGLATGPHLHYEFRINGTHHNPLTVSLPKSSPILAEENYVFKAHAQKMLALFDIHQRVMLAQAH